MASCASSPCWCLASLSHARLVARDVSHSAPALLCGEGACGRDSNARLCAGTLQLCVSCA